MALRERVHEMQRRMARFDEGGDSVRRSDLEVSISEREELLLEAERIAHVGSWVWNVETNEVVWSEELFRILGYDPAVDVASVDNYFAAVHPDDRARVQASSQRGVETGLIEQATHRVLRRDGSVRYVRVDGSHLFDKDGRLRRIVGTAIDETESREAAANLQRANQELEDAQAFAHLGSWSLDLKTEERVWSREFFRILGLDPSVTPSTEVFSACVHPEDREHIYALLMGSRTHGAQSMADARIIRPDGSMRHVRLKGTGERDASGELVRLRGTMLDITDLTLLQQRLAHAEKLETIGRLSGGIAHDFNNIMTVIQSGADLLSDSDPDVLGDIHKAVASARNLTSRLLAFGRQSTLRLERLDPNQVVGETVQLMSRIVGAHVTLRTELDPQVPAATLDAQLTSQALINLVINARDAMPTGGEIVIRTMRREINDTLHAEISVSDTGHGIDEHIRDKIFEPFFTTKGDGHGAGLGLAMVLGAVEQQGGRIHVDSSAAGSRFTLQFVAAPMLPPPLESMRPTRGQSTERPLRMLVVEDQVRVLNVVRKLLERAGHEVLTADRPSLAIHVFQDQGPTIDLIVCDLIMPEMFGTTLIERFEAIHPLPPVLFMSGYGAEATRDIGEGRIILAKPFTAQELQEAIARTLRVASM